MASANPMAGSPQPVEYICDTRGLLQAARSVIRYTPLDVFESGEPPSIVEAGLLVVGHCRTSVQTGNPSRSKHTQSLEPQPSTVISIAPPPSNSRPPRPKALARRAQYAHLQSLFAQRKMDSVREVFSDRWLSAHSNDSFRSPDFIWSRSDKLSLPPLSGSCPRRQLSHSPSSILHPITISEHQDALTDMTGSVHGTDRVTPEALLDYPPSAFTAHITVSLPSPKYHAA
ncbi:hypothetical protein FGIG_09698 [Fasciola gigantica]|uniref:Uncharacterized protein n=1 Tax=Fasciola gigantica TaxID=46835 RepID=A0A504YXS3_FASGI|nr:hypothetical protein FGIG_09698 [Fasciola gigantica]